MICDRVNPFPPWGVDPGYYRIGERRMFLFGMCMETGTRRTRIHRRPLERTASGSMREDRALPFAGVALEEKYIRVL